VLAGGASKVAFCESSQGQVDVLIEVVLPPPKLFVVGAAHDGVPVVAMAHAVGWETVVCDTSSRVGTRERFTQADEILVGSPEDVARQVDACDRALAVVMSHDYERDRACLAALLATKVVYLGMLGPRRRTARMLSELDIAHEDARLHAPVGLALGAETPQEIALSIVSEAQSVLAGAHAGPLRGVAGAIHGELRRACIGA
jgi:xanthine/CO dehydrogenase XdhC/CoxF family maturation factor